MNVRPRITRRAIASLAALAASVPLAIAAVPTAAVAEDLPDIPLTVWNSSDKGSMHLYALGHFMIGPNEVGPEGYLDAEGNFHEFHRAAGMVPEPAADSAIDGPSIGESTTITIPYGFSGRLYYSFDDKLTFRVVIDADNRNGLVQPVPWIPAAADSQVEVDFDWAELSYSEWGLYLNSSQVDQFSAPAAVSSTNEDGTVLRRGVTTRSVEQFAADLTVVPGFEHSLQADGGVARLLNPSKLLETGRMPADYLDAYIGGAWQTYTGGRQLEVRPFDDQPETVYFGSVGDDDIMTFRNTAGDPVAVFHKPTTLDVFACNGALTAPNDLIVGPIARSLCADLNRGVLGTQDVSPAADPTTYYTPNELNGGAFNHFARVVHEGMADGKAYAFAFDDVANHESLVHAPRPRSASLEILPDHGGTAFPDGTEGATSVRSIR
jgi:peptidoglycan hydrolase-like protein with peptidoglycan-binding domain